MRGGDFGVLTDAMVRFAPSVRRRRGILATGVRRESREVNRTKRVVNPTALCGRSAEASGDDLPVVTVDAGSGQMQHDAPHRGLDPGAELHQMFAQGADLGRSEGGARGPQAHVRCEFAFTRAAGSETALDNGFATYSSPAPRESVVDFPRGMSASRHRAHDERVGCCSRF